VTRQPFGLLILCAIATAQDRPVFRTEVRLIEVPAIVRQGDQFVDGLTVSDFEVRDNGSPQPIHSFEVGSTDLSCVLLLDVTGSMERYLPAVRTAIFRLADELPAHPAVAIHTFSDSFRVALDFTADRTEVKQVAMRLRAGGPTALFDAISLSTKILQRRAGRKALIVFTDGSDNASLLSAADSIRRSRQSGIPIFLIAQGQLLKDLKLLDRLGEIVRSTGGALHRGKSAAQVSTAVQRIASELSHLYLVSYTSPAAGNESWRTIQVKIRNRPRLKVHARQGYQP
jgi:Ca-activated chloride channel family protein